MYDTFKVLPTLKITSSLFSSGLMVNKSLVPRLYSSAIDSIVSPNSTV